MDLKKVGFGVLLFGVIALWFKGCGNEVDEKSAVFPPLPKIEIPKDLDKIKLPKPPTPPKVEIPEWVVGEPVPPDVPKRWDPKEGLLPEKSFALLNLPTFDIGVGYGYADTHRLTLDLPLYQHHKAALLVGAGFSLEKGRSFMIGWVGPSLLFNKHLGLFAGATTQGKAIAGVRFQF